MIKNIWLGIFLAALTLSLAGCKQSHTTATTRTPASNYFQTDFQDEVFRLQGIDLEIVDLRSLLPLDVDTILASTRKTSKVLLLHEDTRTGGLGGEIAALISENIFEYLDGPIVRIAAPDTPVPFSPPLEEAFLPNARTVVEKARWLYRY